MKKEIEDKMIKNIQSRIAKLEKTGKIVKGFRRDFKNALGLRDLGLNFLMIKELQKLEERLKEAEEKGIIPKTFKLRNIKDDIATFVADNGVTIEAKCG